jgi:TRAP-type C4-dicarboxylate transport system permease small subunit
MTLKKRIEWCIQAVMAVLMVSMVTVACWQVFSRYVLNAPSVITEELLRFALVLLGMIGAAYSFGTDEHLALTLVSDKIKERSVHLSRFQTLFLKLVNITFAVIVLIIGGWLQIRSNMNQTSPVLLWRMGYVYLMLPMAGGLIVILEVLNIYGLFCGTGEERA